MNLFSLALYFVSALEATMPAQIIQFTKSLNFYPETKLKISCGFLDNSLLDATKINLLKSVPSVEVLYVNLINTIFYPIHQLLRVLKIHSDSGEKVELIEHVASEV